MKHKFPEPILSLPEIDIPVKGIKAHLSQGFNHQIVIMDFSDDVDLAEHSHESQWGVVLEGKIELIIDGVINVFSKGDSYYIPKGIRHSGKIYAGYADVTFFNEPERYKLKNK